MYSGNFLDSPVIRGSGLILLQSVHGSSALHREEDRRIVNIKLTEKGEKAYHHHAEFHRKMVEAVVETLDEEEIPVLTKALDNLYHFFKTYNG